MSNIVTFESGKLPAYLQNTKSDISQDLLAHASVGFPVLSIKGKSWTAVRDGERTTLTKDIDGERVAVPSIDVVILKANKNTSKVFYLNKYVEGSEDKPDCFSNDGVRPDANAEKPQSKACSTCEHNQWGSRIADNGKKGKACADSVRMAVATSNMLNDPYMLRVPPVSIRPLGEYGRMLAKRGVPYNAVVTKIGFEMELATPKLTFRPLSFLSDTEYAQAQEMIGSDIVKAILGSALVADDEIAGTLPKAVQPPPIEKLVEPVAEKPVRAVKQAAKEVKQEKIVEIEDDDIPDFNLDDLI